MPDITAENDPYTFKVGIKRGTRGDIYVDGMELAAHISTLDLNEDEEPAPEVIAEAVRQVGWLDENRTWDEYTDTEVFSVGAKVLARMNELGNSPGPRPSSRPSTA